MSIEEDQEGKQLEGASDFGIQDDREVCQKPRERIRLLRNSKRGQMRKK